MSNMSNSVKVLNFPFISGWLTCFVNSQQPSNITNVYEMLIMQPGHAYAKLHWLPTSNSRISCHRDVLSRKA